MERKKHEAVPIQPDFSPEWEAAQAWGYIVTAYVIAEQAFKALLHHTIGFDHVSGSLRGTHRLRDLFVSLNPNDRQALRDNYLDYCCTERAESRGIEEGDVESFLDHLDDGRGAVGWRYSLAEDAESSEIPHFRHMHLELLWELIRSLRDLIYSTQNGRPSLPHSRRQRQIREHVYREWCFEKQTSEDDWARPDRIELMWGPDPAGNSDFLVFRNAELEFRFGDIDEAQAALALNVVDRRDELAALAGPGNPAFGVRAESAPSPERHLSDELAGMDGLSAIEALFDLKKGIALSRCVERVRANRDSWTDAEFQEATDECEDTIRDLEKDRLNAIVDFLFSSRD